MENQVNTNIENTQFFHFKECIPKLKKRILSQWNIVSHLHFPEAIELSCLNYPILHYFIHTQKLHHCLFSIQILIKE